MPTVSVGLLGLLMSPAQAAAILVVPSLVTNVWQALIGGSFWELVRRLWPVLVGICVSTFIGAVLLPTMIRDARLYGSELRRRPSGAA